MCHVSQLRRCHNLNDNKNRTDEEITQTFRDTTTDAVPSTCFRCERRLDFQKESCRSLYQKSGNLSEAPVPQCDVVCHPFWQSDPICGSCAKGSRRCVVCERPTRGWIEPWLSLGSSPGRETYFLCHCCYGAGVASTENDLLNIIQQAIDFLAEHPQIRLDIRKHFAVATEVNLQQLTLQSCPKTKPILFIHYTTLHSLCESPCPKLSPMRGITVIPKSTPTVMGQHSIVSAWSEEIIFGKFQAQTIKPMNRMNYFSRNNFNISQKVNEAIMSSNNRNEEQDIKVYNIELCHKLQKDTLISVLVHEIVHAIFSLYGIVLSLEFEEAVCNAMTVLFLNSRAEILSKDQKIEEYRSRMNICQFRSRRLLLGDTPSTCRLAEAVSFLNHGEWKKQLGLIL